LLQQHQDPLVQGLVVAYLVNKRTQLLELTRGQLLLAFIQFALLPLEALLLLVLALVEEQVQVVDWDIKIISLLHQAHLTQLL
jgi:hypothetical protein